MPIVKNFLRRYDDIIIGASLSWFISYGAIVATEDYMTKIVAGQIRDRSVLEEVLVEERDRLNIGKDVKITIKESNRETNYAEKTGANEYSIYLTTKGHNRDVLRHELYHIADGHCERSMEKPINKIIYFFWEEPQAKIYTLTGLKL